MTAAAGIIKCKQTGQIVELVDTRAPAEGIYVYEPDSSNSKFSWARGPEGAGSYRGPSPEESWYDTESSTSAHLLPSQLILPVHQYRGHFYLIFHLSTQTRFREMLLCRDRACILPRELAPLHAAHLIPKDRAHLYMRLLGRDYDSANEPECGTMLKQDVHATYDRFRRSLFARVT